jgi:hypothetical protein
MSASLKRAKRGPWDDAWADIFRRERQPYQRLDNMGE